MSVEPKIRDLENQDDDDAEVEEEEDQTFQPPALSSYAMSLLNEINNKTSKDVSTKQYDFQPRLQLHGRYSSTTTHERTGTTATDRTSIGHTTPYTAFISSTEKDDIMEISPDNKQQQQQQQQVHFELHTPLNSQKVRKNPTASRLSLLDKSQRRFARVSLGAPKRVTKKDDEDEIDHENLKWIEDEKEKIRLKNQEIMLKLAELEDKKKEQETPISNKENLLDQYYRSSMSSGRRKVLSSISPNIDNQQRRVPGSPYGKNKITINGKNYTYIQDVGKGGSSIVFKLRSNSSGKMYAIKKVTFDEFDESAISGFKGEIHLLQKLSQEQRVVKLLDFAINETSIMLVMECGDIDLAHVLTTRINMPLDISFVRYHLVEMFKCVAAVHNAGIVHSDLKPANFLFVRGILKIIDFGIANALSDHTVNVYRDSQIGTPNYMSPESLLEVNNNKESTWKVGRLSDVWSCGCILYQMIYGRPPYAIYSGNQRLLAIMNPQVKISYPETGLGGVRVPKTAIDTMKNCLTRDPNKRWTIDQVLQSSFCTPRNVSKEFIEDLVTNAINFGSKNGDDISRESLSILTNEVWSKIEELNL